MATTTTQLALRKPVGSDQVNVTTDVGDNMQKIDDVFDPTSGHTHAGTTGNGPQIGADGIADAAVTAAKIGNDAVDSQHYAAGSIDTEHLGDDQVTQDKLDPDIFNDGGDESIGHNLNNLLLGGDFEVWTAGTSTNPDGWTSWSSGANHAVAREGTIVKRGSYSMKLTRGGSDCLAWFDAIARAGGTAYVTGRKFTLGAWVYATVADRVRLSLDDNGSSVYSSYHTGGSAWEWLTVTITGGTPTKLNAALEVDTGDTSGYIDGAILVEGEFCPAFYPHPSDAQAAPNFSAYPIAGTGGSQPGGTYGAPYRLNGATDYCSGQVQVPRDFNSLTAVYVELHGNATGTIDWTVAGTLQKDGQAVNADMDSTTADGHSLTANVVDEIDVTAAFNGLTIAAVQMLTFNFTVDALATVSLLQVNKLRFHYA